MVRAREAFRESIEEDPWNAYAYSGLSKYYILSDIYHYKTDVDGDQSAALAYAYAQRAIELEPNLADGYLARSLMTRQAYGPVAEVSADCQRAIELEPGGAENLAWCAQTLRMQGEADLGLKAAEEAVSMDPQNAGRRMSLAYIALALGDFEKAAAQARLAYELENEMMSPRAIEAWALLLGGDPAGCAERELGPHAVVRATCLQEMGRRDEATATIDSVKAALASGNLHDNTFTPVVRTGDLAIYYAWNGNHEEALRWLEQSYAFSPSGVDQRVLGSALFERVREGSDFQDRVNAIQSQVWERVRRAGEAAYRQRFQGF
jgi:tetratricopeptide (TPR) repeat protein